MSVFAELSPPYGTILADPAWPFEWNGGQGGRRRRRTNLGYSTMAIEEIAALPVVDLVGDDAHLYLWVTREVHREGGGVSPWRGPGALSR